MFLPALHRARIRYKRGLFSPSLSDNSLLVIKICVLNYNSLTSGWDENPSSKATDNHIDLLNKDVTEKSLIYILCFVVSHFVFILFNLNRSRIINNLILMTINA